MKRKVLSFLLLICMVFSASACGKTAKKVEEKNSKESVENKKSDFKMETVDLKASNLEDEWKKEAYYGKKIKVGFEGALCTCGLGIAQVKGFFAKQGLDAEVINSPNMYDARDIEKQLKDRGSFGK